jgi:hypothetical protein
MMFNNVIAHWDFKVQLLFPKIRFGSVVFAGLQGRIQVNKNVLSEHLDSRILFTQQNSLSCGLNSFKQFANEMSSDLLYDRGTPVAVKVINSSLVSRGLSPNQSFRRSFNSVPDKSTHSIMSYKAGLFARSSCDEAEPRNASGASHGSALCFAQPVFVGPQSNLFYSQQLPRASLQDPQDPTPPAGQIRPRQSLQDPNTYSSRYERADSRLAHCNFGDGNQQPGKASINSNSAHEHARDLADFETCESVTSPSADAVIQCGEKCDSFFELDCPLSLGSGATSEAGAAYDVGVGEDQFADVSGISGSPQATKGSSIRTRLKTAAAVRLSMQSPLFRDIRHVLLALCLSKSCSASVCPRERET